MSYEKHTIPNLADHEQGYKLDNGTLVAVKKHISRNPVHSAVTCSVDVRAVDKQGASLVDADGQPVVTNHTWTMNASYMNEAGGKSIFATNTMRVALGEPDAPGYADDNIRIAVQALESSGFVDDDE